MPSFHPAIHIGEQFCTTLVTDKKELHDLNNMRTSKYLQFMFIDGGLQMPDTGNNHKQLKLTLAARQWQRRKCSLSSC